MELSKELTKSFAEVVNSREAVTKEGGTAYGMVIRNGDEVFVQLDGTETLTPVGKAMDAEQDDRVIVSVKDHAATIIGNITSPASARTATNFMKLTEAGLVVGTLGGNGRPTGTYSLIAPGVYKIMDENDTELASFSKDEISLGRGAAVFGTDSISLANGMATFSEKDGVSLGRGIASFTKEEIVLADGMATINGEEISLANGKAVFNSKSISLDDEMVKIDKEGVTLSKGVASFGLDSISLSNGMVSINAREINLGKGAAVFGLGSISFNGVSSFTRNKITLMTADPSGSGGLKAEFEPGMIKLASGMATITGTEVSLAGGKATFTTDAVSLAGNMGRFTATSVSLANGKATFTTDAITLAGGAGKFTSTSVSLSNGKSTFTENKITLADNMVVIDATVPSITLGKASNTNKAVFGADSIILGGSHGKTEISSSEIKLADGEVILAPTQLQLGTSNGATIFFCNKKASIKMDTDSVMAISSNSGPVGLRSNVGTYRAESVCKASSSTAQAGLQVFNTSGLLSSAIVDQSGVRFSTFNGVPLTNNGIEIVQADGVIASGTCYGDGKIEAGKRKTITVELKKKDAEESTVPVGYHLAGIRQITTNHNNACRMTQFFTHPGTSSDHPYPRVGATFVNAASSDITIKVKIEWFALKCNKINNAGDSYITWSDGGEDTDGDDGND